MSKMSNWAIDVENRQVNFQIASEMYRAAIRKTLDAKTPEEKAQADADFKVAQRHLINYTCPV